MKTRAYTVRYYGHLESLDYRDGHCQLWLQGSKAGIPRIYCSDTVKLPFSDRERVLTNLCDYYGTDTNPVIVVIDAADKHRRDLERLVTQLAAAGRKITIEYDTAERREQFERGWHLTWLKAGKKLKVEGTEIATVEDYLRWKDAQRGDPPGADSAGDPSSSVM